MALQTTTHLKASTVALTLIGLSLIGLPLAQAEPKKTALAPVFLSVAGGIGGADVLWDNLPSAQRETIWLNSARAGVFLNDHLRLALELDAWSIAQKWPDGTTSFALRQLSAVALYTPLKKGWRRRAYVKGGLGAMQARAHVSGALDTSVSSIGPAWVGGIGYDHPLTRRLSLSPAITYWMGWPGDLKHNGRAILSGTDGRTLHIEIGLTFR
ncbi:MAG: porin family protein [Vicinamibacteria bacterium]|nr:porin family protein [Vicinamibacteria bacterium]